MAITIPTPAGNAHSQSSALRDGMRAPGQADAGKAPAVLDCTDFAALVCVHQLFEHQAATRSEAVAVCFGEERLTFGELNNRANQLARHLRAQGVGPDVLVGFCVRRSLDMVVGLLGILKAGGAYVPLDPDFPKDRLAFMLEDALAPVLVTQSGLAAELPTGAAKIVRLDSDWSAIAEQETADLPCATTAANLAYVIYTSGSTGKPKGVQVAHGSVVNFLHSMCRAPGLTERDVVPALTTLSFDIAGLEIFLPLVVGARLIVLSRELAQDGGRLAEWLADSDVTVVQATPATWRLLLNAGWRGDQRLKILCGGEALPRPLAKQLQQRCGELWNVYGPTETTIWSTLQQVNTDDGPVPIGFPIDQTAVYVLGSNLQPVPTGEIGELYIGGSGLARGYRRRPDLTADKFLPDPFSAVLGARMYRTGDLARFLPDGSLECLGRVDHQVKLRGYRIELGEIETALGQHAKVREAVVVARDVGDGEKRLVAHIIARSSVEAGELRRFLQSRLPSYMVPSAYVFLKRLPLTPNGKVDRLALPPPPGRMDDSGPYMAPRTTREAQIAQCAEDVLGINRIGIRANLLDLGLDSIRGAVLILRIEAIAGRKLPPGALFEATTIEGLAQLLEQGVGQRRWSSLVPIQPHGDKAPFFAVHGGAGTIFPLYPLAQHLGPEQPFFCLQQQGLYGDAPPHTRVEDMAEHYLKEIRAVQPHGPYYLGGYCFGGVVAYEMAQRLKEQGEEVALLALFNAPAPVYTRGLRQQERKERLETNRLLVRPPQLPKLTEMRGRSHKLAHFVKRSYGAVAWRVRVVRQQLSWRWRIRRINYYFRRRLPIPASLRDVFFQVSNGRAELAYTPKPYAGSMLLFRADDLYTDPLLGWAGQALGGIEVVAIPGEHINQRTMMRSEMAALVAEHLRRHLPTVNQPLAAHPRHDVATADM